jgi:exonuclease VII small subunit
MGFFTTWGYLIVLGTVVGFLFGIGEAFASHSIIIVYLSFLGLLSGLYIGLIGPMMERQGQQIEALESLSSGTRYAELESTTDSLERRGPVDLDTAKEDLANLEADYARAKPHLSQAGEEVYQAKLREARRKVESYSSRPSG